MMPQLKPTFSEYYKTAEIKLVITSTIFNLVRGKRK